MSPTELCTLRQAPSGCHSLRPLLRARSSLSSSHPWLRLALKVESSPQTIFSAHSKPWHHLLERQQETEVGTFLEQLQTALWCHGDCVHWWLSSQARELLDNPLFLFPNTITRGAGKLGTRDRVYWSGCEQTKANHMSKGLCSLHWGHFFALADINVSTNGIFIIIIYMIT